MILNFKNPKLFMSNVPFSNEAKRIYLIEDTIFLLVIGAEFVIYREISIDDCVAYILNEKSKQLKIVNGDNYRSN